MGLLGRFLEGFAFVWLLQWVLKGIRSTEEDE